MNRAFVGLTSLLIGACVACGVGDTYQLPVQPVKTPRVGGPIIDSELKLYVELFMADCETRRSDCQKRLDKVEEVRLKVIPDLDKDDESVTVGLCYLSMFGSNKVHINKNIFSYGHKYVQTVVYHELGHCMYDLDHEEKDDMLMSAMMPDLSTLIQGWPQLLDDFFAAIEEQHGP